MILKYTIDPTVEEPIMLIDKHIGNDVEDGMGINGTDFARELLYLDSLGKKTIQIRINSVGGSVMDGMAIYNAILKTSAKVDTYNVGIAASIAAVIFQAGRNRVMADYSLLMIHNPHGGDKKMLALMKESLIKMIQRRTDKTDKQISDMMSATTWLTATECMQNGLCDSIEASADMNKPRIKSLEVKDAYKEALQIVNSINKPKTKSMLNVTNRLGLEAEATENDILAKIDEIENKSKSEIEAAKKSVEEMENALNEAKKKVAELEADAKAKAEDDCKNKAAELINDAVKAGKIVNKDEVIALWVKNAIIDLDGTKNIIENLTVSKQSPKIETKAEEVNSLTNSVARAMAEIRSKLGN